MSLPPNATCSGKSPKQCGQSLSRDPPTELGKVATALADTLVSTLDLASIRSAEVEQVLGMRTSCAFGCRPEYNPALWLSESGVAAMKLNGVLVELQTKGDLQEGGARTFLALEATVSVRQLGEAEDWCQTADFGFG